MSVTEQVEHVPEVIRRLTQVSGVTQDQIAERFDFSRQAVNMRLNDKIKWQIEDLGALADFFGVPLELFFMDPERAVKVAVADYEVAGLRFRLGPAKPGPRRGSRQGKRGSQWNTVFAGQSGLLAQPA